MSRKMLSFASRFIFTLSCLSLSAAPSEAREGRGQAQSLETAARDLSLLSQYVMSLKQPNGEERDRVVRALKSLKAAAHPIDGSMRTRALDPLLAQIDLEPRVRWSQIEAIYVHGNYAHARYLTRHTVQACVACHGGSYETTALGMPFPKPSPVLSDSERADYLAMFRRSKEAILAYEEMLSQTSLRQTKPELWESALAHLLAMTIRVRNDAHITLELISRLSELGSYPPAQKEMLLAWRQSAKQWTREARKKTISTEQATIKIQELLIQADRSARASRTHGMVDYLRVLNLVDAVAKNPDRSHKKTMAFRIGGETAEKIHDSFYWIYPEVYFEACIRSLPNSTESSKCWQRFEDFRRRERFTLWDREMAAVLKEMAI